MCFSDKCGDNEVKSIVSNCKNLQSIYKNLYKPEIIIISALKLIGAFKVASSKSAKCDDTKTVEKPGLSIAFM